MPRKHHRKPSYLPQILAIGGLALLVIAILAFKEKPQAATPTASASDSAEVRLDRALAENRPTLAFFHSNTCHQCQVMMETVAQVYPDFAETVVLVDINVYDESNEALLKRVGLQYIPTLIFYDHTGKEQVSVGVMEAEALRQTLAALAGGD
jgi:thiol:disulfide interchange protein